MWGGDRRQLSGSSGRVELLSKRGADRRKVHDKRSDVVAVVALVLSPLEHRLHADALTSVLGAPLLPPRFFDVLENLVVL